MHKQAAKKSFRDSLNIHPGKYVPENTKIRLNETPQMEASENLINLNKLQKHLSFEKRLSEYDGKINVIPFNWGEPQGRELI